MSCGVGHSHGLDPVLVWLWGSPAATGPILSLAWAPPYAQGATQKAKSKAKQNKTKHLTSIHEDAGLIPGLT